MTLQLVFDRRTGAAAGEKVMRALAIFIAVALFGSFTAAVAAPMEAVVGSTALLCMGNLKRPAVLIEHLGKEGAQLRPEHANGFLKPHRGKAFLNKFDNGGEMVSAIPETGGCKIFSREASRQGVQNMLIEEYKSVVRSRLLRSEADKGVVRSTYAVSFRGERMFVVVFGPEKPNGVAVDILPADRPPSTISPGAKIVWPE